MDQGEALRALVLAALWLIYFLLHSVLASLGVKRWVARRHLRFMPYYRIAYNLMALVLLVPPLVLMLAWRGELLWQWQGVAWWLVNGLALLSLAGFAWSMRYYDGSEFLGLRQARERVTRVEDQESLTISPLHRFVRHPWYTLGLVLVWSREMDGMLLVSALAITLYFMLGSRLEEKKLIAYHGDAYRRYRSRVPGLIPLPWRYLSRREAEELSLM